MNLFIATCQDLPGVTKSNQRWIDLIKNGSHLISSYIDQIKIMPWDEMIPSLVAEDQSCVIISSTWDYHKSPSVFLAWCQAMSRSALLINPLDTIKWNINKNYLNQLSQTSTIVPSLFLKNYEEHSILEFLNSLKETMFVAKPTISASSYLTFRGSAQKLQEYKPEFEKILSHSEIVIQPFIHNILVDGEASLVFFKIGGRPQFSHAVIKKAGPADFRVQRDFGGTTEPLMPSDSLVKFAEAALSETHKKSIYARVDIVNWKSFPMISEIELIEPELFFPYATNKEELFLQAIFEEIKSY